MPQDSVQPPRGSPYPDLSPYFQQAFWAPLGGTGSTPRATQTGLPTQVRSQHSWAWAAPWTARVSDSKARLPQECPPVPYPQGGGQGAHSTIWICMARGNSVLDIPTSGPSQAQVEGNRDLQSPHSVPQDSGSWENRKSPELEVSRPEFSTQLSLLSQLWGRYESPWVSVSSSTDRISWKINMITCNAVGTKIGNKAASSPEKKDIRPIVTAGSYCGESESHSVVSDSLQPYGL